jgi:hypothetical protein
MFVSFSDDTDVVTRASLCAAAFVARVSVSRDRTMAIRIPFVAANALPTTRIAHTSVHPSQT